ncbi:MAG: hypothetical protein MUF27_14865 [Acidobacteria bacterium]|jgi:hypothetical protein|nr:hypothetical protein [Acidobacteriota bacterium]
MNRTICQTARWARTPAVPAILVAAALALGGTALAGGGHQAVRTDGPIAIGGRVYPAGLLELEKLAGSGKLWAVTLDGRRIAAVFRETTAGATGFALYRDEVGLLHLRGVHVAGTAGGASEYVYRRSGFVELHASAPALRQDAD